MKYLKTVILVSLLLTVSISVQAGTFDPVNVGARASAMGGAYIGLADDASAVYWNPAGLAGLNRTEWQITARSRKDILETDFQVGTMTDTKKDHSHFGVSFAGLAVPFELYDKKMAFAIGYMRPIELITYYESSFNDAVEDIKGGVFSLSPTFAMELMEGVSFGAGVNIWTGKRTCDIYQFSSDLEWEAKYSGTNFTFGTQVDVQKFAENIPVTIGVSAKTPFDLGIDYEDLTFGTDIDSATVISYDMEMPFMFGVGIAYRPIENLVLTADFENRVWSTSELIEYHNGNENVYINSKSGEDIRQLRFGAEYSMEIGESTVAFRGGYARIPTLKADWDGSKYTDQTVSNLFSAGLGFSSNRYALDLVWSQQQYERESQTNYFPGSDYTVTQTWQVIQISGRFFVNIW